MKCVLVSVLFAGIAIANAPNSRAQVLTSNPQSSLKSVSPSLDVPTLPPPPKGKSTVIGGEIRNVDPVRDQITLKVMGQRPVKILFDARTQVFVDGNKIPLRELGPAAHASVQTLLDGTDVYALSIHLMSQSPGGEFQGRVLAYNSDTGELTVSSDLFEKPVKALITADTTVARVGQPEFTRAGSGAADLVKGTLISVNFQPDKQGRSVAKQISVLAIPGSRFVFDGSLSVLDLHAGMLALVDPLDQKTYRIFFSSANMPVTSNLHTGDRVIVTAEFDGVHYMASEIKLNN
jgi:hypothetical protein